MHCYAKNIANVFFLHPILSYVIPAPSTSSSQYPLPRHPSTLYLVIPVRDTGIYIYYGSSHRMTGTVLCIF
ncbi:MAG: hypothetical protein ACEY3H_04000 [Wolbachia sp.]